MTIVGTTLWEYPPIRSGLDRITHEWTEVMKIRRLSKFKCTGCGDIRWERHAFRLKVLKEPTVSCREMIVTGIHES